MEALVASVSGMNNRTSAPHQNHQQISRFPTVRKTENRFFSHFENILETVRDTVLMYKVSNGAGGVTQFSSSVHKTPLSSWFLERITLYSIHVGNVIGVTRGCHQREVMESNSSKHKDNRREIRMSRKCSGVVRSLPMWQQQLGVKPNLWTWTKWYHDRDMKCCGFENTERGQG